MSQKAETQTWAAHVRSKINQRGCLCKITTDRTMPKSVSVFPSELTDDVQRKLAEYFTTTASFLAGCSGGIRGEKRVKTDKEAVEESLSAPPFQNCERHWRVNKPPTDCWPLINTLFGSHGAECRNTKGRCVPRTLLQKPATTNCTTSTTHRNVERVCH